MTKRLNISYDSDLIESISADFDLRNPNKEALRNRICTHQVQLRSMQL